jgi:hypothetical protein
MRLYTTERDGRVDYEWYNTTRRRKRERERERERKDATVDQALHDEHTLSISNVVDQRLYVLFGNIPCV